MAVPKQSLSDREKAEIGDVVVRSARDALSVELGPDGEFEAQAFPPVAARPVTFFHVMLAPMAHRIQIRVLGDFCVTLDDRVVGAVAKARLRSLLGYLVLRRGTPQLRAHLAFLFWPDSSEQQALTNLRHVLHELRQALPEVARFLEGDNRTVTW